MCFEGEPEELIKHGLRALRETLPNEQELTTKVQWLLFVKPAFNSQEISKLNQSTSQKHITKQYITFVMSSPEKKKRGPRQDLNSGHLTGITCTMLQGHEDI